MLFYKSFHQDVVFLFFVLLISSCSGRAATQRPVREFEYREIYLPERGSKEYKDLGLDNLDDMWGIWGHNLDVVIPEEHSKTIYAKVKGNTHEEQYCFSSRHLLKYIEDYIVNNYGEDSGVNFAIIPNDNNVVCLCERCIEAGNVKGDTSPALFNMIKKLSARFPNHRFFTSYYKTTRNFPTDTLPDNVGVFVSAIEFPLSTVNTLQEGEFENVLRQWSDKTNTIYVWDYINNFDDYFTPYPIFGAMQRRLQLYDDYDVKGIFFNGSGEDYSTFSRLKTHVLNAMLDDDNADWRDVLRFKAKEFYPVAGERIADFMIAQEDFVEKQQSQLPLYQGVATAIQTYLPVDEFIKFHEDLKELIPQASGEEKAELQKMDRAFELTRLELLRIGGDISGYSDHIDNLKKLSKQNGITAYNESGWTIDKFISDYDYMALQSEGTRKNLLKGAGIQPLSKLDPDYTDVSILTDGLLSIPSNYHDGMMIMSPGGKWRIAVPRVDGMKQIRVWMPEKRAFRVGLPAKVNLLVGGELVKSVTPKSPVEHTNHTYVDLDIPRNGTGSLIVEFVPNEENGTFAIEEIQGM